MNFNTFLKFSKIHKNSAQKNRLTISYITRGETGLLKTGPEIWSTFIRTSKRTSELWTMLKQLLNGNNGLSLIRTPN